MARRLALSSRNVQAALRVEEVNDAASEDGEEPSTKPENWREAVLYAFREIARWDFCFIVLGLAVADGLWLLLPLGAVGAQAYWMALFFSAARRFQG